jgi:aminotransferase
MKKHNSQFTTHNSQHSKLALSSRSGLVKRSEIRDMSIECEKVGGINLSQGVMDTPPPPVVIEAAEKAMKNGLNSYTRHDGIRPLREAISRKQEKFTGISFDPEREIVVSAGATGAFYCACLALLEPGDEVIVFEPFYGYHVSTLSAVGAVPVTVKLKAPDWSFAKEEIEDKVSEKTKAILINTPANPGGKVFTREEVEAVAEIAEKHDLYIFTDEIYEHFVYDGRSHFSPSAVSSIRDRVITISGVSKVFSVTGWRIGYCLCHSKWAKAIGHFNDLVYVCAPAPLQAGVAEGLNTLGENYYAGLKTEYAQKRDMVCASLEAAGLSPIIPQGAYYVLADLSPVPGADSKQKAMYLLDRAGVACVPGEAFYEDEGGQAQGRFCFAKEKEVVAEACKGLEKLQGSI